MKLSTASVQVPWGKQGRSAQPSMVSTTCTRRTTCDVMPTLLVTEYVMDWPVPTIKVLVMPLSTTRDVKSPSTSSIAMAPW